MGLGVRGFRRDIGGVGVNLDKGITGSRYRAHLLFTSPRSWLGSTSHGSAEPALLLFLTLKKWLFQLGILFFRSCLCDTFFIKRFQDGILTLILLRRLTPFGDHLQSASFVMRGSKMELHATYIVHMGMECCILP